MPIATLAIKKWQRLRRNFGIHAPEVRVSSHRPWHWYALAAAGMIIATSLCVYALFYFIHPGSIESASLRQRVAELEQQIVKLRQSSSTETSDLLIAASTQKSLMEKLSYLERQNAELKEDIVFYEKVGIKGDSERGLRIQRARFEKDLTSPHVYRYRLLIAYNGNDAADSFKGSIKFNVSGLNKGAPVNFTLPQAKDSALSDYQINVSNIENKEGSIEVPPDTSITKVEVVIVQGDSVKTRQTIQVK